MGDKGEKHNPSYYRFFALILTSLGVVWGVYIPGLVLGANAYVGNRVMINFGSWAIYILASNAIFHVAWLVVFFSRFRKLDEPWAEYLKSHMHTFDYKHTLCMWATMASSLFIIELVFYIVIGASSTVGFWGVLMGASSTDYIGSTGTYGYFDDMWQLCNLLTFLFSFVSMIYFFHLNMQLYVFGTSDRKDARI